MPSSLFYSYFCSFGFTTKPNTYWHRSAFGQHTSAANELWNDKTDNFAFCTSGSLQQVFLLINVLSNQHIWCAPRFVWFDNCFLKSVFKKLVCATVHVNSGTNRCWSERSLPKLWKWTAVNYSRFGQIVFVCACSISFLTDGQEAGRHLYIFPHPALVIIKTFVIHSK